MQARTKNNFILDDDAVDPNLVPKTTLYTGAQLPSVGLGTFGSDAISGETVAAAVKSAAKVGYRHFDCASVYGNEAQIGSAIEAAMAELGIERSELRIMTRSGTTRERSRRSGSPTCRSRS